MELVSQIYKPLKLVLKETPHSNNSIYNHGFWNDLKVKGLWLGEFRKRQGKGSTAPVTMFSVYKKYSNGFLKSELKSIFGKNS